MHQMSRNYNTLDLLPHPKHVKVFLPLSFPASPPPPPGVPAFLSTLPPSQLASYQFRCWRATVVSEEAVVESPPA